LLSHAITKWNRISLFALSVLSRLLNPINRREKKQWKHPVAGTGAVPKSGAINPVMFTPRFYVFVAKKLEDAVSAF
jgi:hypothetical protein